MSQEFDYIIVKVPEGTLFDNLTNEQQNVVSQALDARWIPSILPGTQPVGGYQLVGAIVPRQSLINMAQQAGLDLTAVVSDPAALKATMEGIAASYGLTWELMYMRTVDGQDTGTMDPDGNPVITPLELYPMDPRVGDYLSPVDDGTGNRVPPTPPVQLAAFDMPGIRRWPVVLQ